MSLKFPLSVEPEFPSDILDSEGFPVVILHFSADHFIKATALVFVQGVVNALNNANVATSEPVSQAA